jgi:hypothetical protein
MKPGKPIKRYIVQERHRTCDWYDDPDVPESRTPQAAVSKLNRDDRHGHGKAFRHRIIERIETLLILP